MPGWRPILRASSGGWRSCSTSGSASTKPIAYPFPGRVRGKKLDNVSVGGLKLRLRADRIDLLENGQRLLLDYKSGEVSVKDWEGERPDEPQRPLYAIFGN